MINLPVKSVPSSWIESHISPDGRKIEVRKKMLRLHYNQLDSGINASDNSFRFDLREHFRNAGLTDGTLTLQISPFLLVPITESITSKVTQPTVGGADVYWNKTPDVNGLTIHNEHGMEVFCKHRSDCIVYMPTRGELTMTCDNPGMGIAFQYLTFFVFDHFIDNRVTPR